ELARRPLDVGEVRLELPPLVLHVHAREVQLHADLVAQRAHDPEALLDLVLQLGRRQTHGLSPKRRRRRPRASPGGAEATAFRWGSVRRARAHRPTKGATAVPRSAPRRRTAGGSAFTRDARRRGAGTARAVEPVGARATVG